MRVLTAYVGWREFHPRATLDPASRGQWNELNFLKPFVVDTPICPVTGKKLETLNAAEANRGNRAKP